MALSDYIAWIENRGLGMVADKNLKEVHATDNDRIYPNPNLKETVGSGWDNVKTTYAVLINVANATDVRNVMLRHRPPYTNQDVIDAVAAYNL